MTIKDLREILIHYQDRKYDDWEIILFDYNNQRVINWLDGTYASSRTDKRITFPVKVEPIDGETVDERIKRIISEMAKDN